MSERVQGVARWAVRVEEARVNATAAGARWWYLFRQSHGKGEVDRFTDIRITLGGATTLVACDSREHAEWLAHHMVTCAGLPRSAVRVVTVKPTHRPHRPGRRP